MFTHKGGHKVAKGTYWEVRSGHRVDIADEGLLPGDVTASYLRAPATVMILMGPIIGLLYVIALPFIGIAVVAAQLVGKILEGLYNLIGKSASFGWRPKNAYLTGKKKKKKDEQ